jgi:hypothetical protein
MSGWRKSMSTIWATQISHFGSFLLECRLTCTNVDSNLCSLHQAMYVRYNPMMTTAIILSHSKMHECYNVKSQSLTVTVVHTVCVHHHTSPSCSLRIHDSISREQMSEFIHLLALVCQIHHPENKVHKLW